jgi:hypothetical protein
MGSEQGRNKSLNNMIIILHKMKSISYNVGLFGARVG